MTIMVHDNTVLPVSVLGHRSHRPAMLSTPPSAALMKYGCGMMQRLRLNADRNPGGWWAPAPGRRGRRGNFPSLPWAWSAMMREGLYDDAA
jgi:hypothetical protein